MTSLVTPLSVYPKRSKDIILYRLSLGELLWPLFPSISFFRNSKVTVPEFVLEYSFFGISLYKPRYDSIGILQ